MPDATAAARATPAPPTALGGATLAEEKRLAEEAQRALAERPKLSINLRLYVSMSVCFLLVAAVVGSSLALISRVGKSQQFLEKVSTYGLEVEHARRFEKNYLLYGTNLEDALVQVETAHHLLRSMKPSMVELVGPWAFERLEANLDQYGAALERLATLRRAGSQPTSDDRVAVERALRRHGAQVVADATDLLDRERLSLRAAIQTAWQVAAASLLFIFFGMGLLAYTLSRQVARPLRRFLLYTQRISQGDFSPIQPARRYRDEFSDLALAVNRMLFQLREREVQLTRTSRMAAVGTLTAGIAHELNNPLNNIGLNAEALQDALETYSDEQKHKMLADIVSQVERASGTVRNLLDFTRVDKPVFVSLSVGETVRGAQKLVRNEAELCGVTLEVDLPASLPRVEGNPRDLQQVFLNLFLNAIQAMPGGGTIRVKGERIADGGIRVEVADTGTGIPPENLGSIFDPFFTTKEVGVGTGLGLFVTYGIVEKHRGSIAVRSEVGRGTTFTITLPAAPAPGTREETER